MINTDECWFYAGHINSNGYGLVFSEGKRIYAHRVMYEAHKNGVPKGLQIDHLCRNRRCVNPEHLEPVSRKDNILRGNGLTAINARKTHCINGHPFDKMNTYIVIAGRKCRECIRINMRKRYKKLHTPR